MFGLISSLSIRLQSLIALFIALALLADDARTFENEGVPAMIPNLTLDWQPLPDLPDELGVAGPFVGVHNDALMVAGGANFPRPVWENVKEWHDQIYVLTKTAGGYVWKVGGSLPRAIGYGAAVSTPIGVVCMGGNDQVETFRDVFMLRWDTVAAKVTRTDFPMLPRACAFGQATLIGSVIYLAGGQSGLGLDSAMNNFWALDLSKQDEPGAFVWKELQSFPGSRRALNITVCQHNGSDECLYVMGGRFQEGEQIKFLDDVWEFTPGTQAWRRRADLPRSVMAGTGIALGSTDIYVLGGDDGTLFFKADELKDQHPGFRKEVLAYNTTTDKWTSAGSTPQNQVTTIPVRWNDRIIIASGEVRPRVRTASVWSIMPRSKASPAVKHEKAP